MRTSQYMTCIIHYVATIFIINYFRDIIIEHHNRVNVFDVLNNNLFINLLNISTKWNQIN